MIKRIAYICILLLSMSCERGLNLSSHGVLPVVPKPEKALTPAACDNNIVAHRGGSAECGFPDNSLSSLKYAMSLKLRASECDIYWTKDNNVIVAHANHEYKVNGLIPWEHTLTEIRLAGRLKNGEEIPTLEDFLQTVMVKDNPTMLMLDIKYTSPEEYASRAVRRACEIIKKQDAKNFCMFICTSSQKVGEAAAACMKAYDIPVGWMANRPAEDFKKKGFTWANLSAKSYMAPYGPRTLNEFSDAAMEISVFCVDKKGSKDANAVTSESDVKYYIDNCSKLKYITTNYPKWLLNKTK